MRDKNEFQGWGVLAAAIILSFIPTAIMNNCFALYMNPVCADLGFSNGAWSLVSMIASFTSAAGAIVLAGLYQKRNMKLWMVFCALFASACFFIATYCTAIWQMYLVFGISSFFLAGLTQLPISMLITAWFESKRSTMMSIAMAGGGLGGLVWSPVLTRFISASPTGWKHAMLFSAAVVLTVMVLTALFLVKRSPQEYGTAPYRTGDGNDLSTAGSGWIGVSRKTAVSSGAWKFILGTVILIGALASGVTTHMPNFVAEIADQTMSGRVLSIYSLMSIAGMVGGGMFMDKIGIKKTTLIAVIFAAAGLLCLVGADVFRHPALAYGYCIFFAIGMCLPKVLPAILISDVFGTRDYAGIYSLANLFFLVGAALGSILTSILQSFLGYSGAWIVYMILAVLFFLCVSGALRGGRHLKELYPEGEPENA